MAVTIEETFQVAAPPERVWAYLIDPQQVVVCLPGASLTEVVDERTFLGKVKIKVGPVTASYDGKVQITEQDDQARTVKMMGKGMEASGAGSAEMTLTSQVVGLDDGGTEVRVQQDVEVVGKLAQFGRGMVQEVGKQLFRQFVGCAKKHLEAEAAAAPAADAAEGATPETPSAPAEVGSAAPEAGSAPVATEGAAAPASAAAASAGTADDPGTAPSKGPDTGAGAAPAGEAAPASAAADAAPPSPPQTEGEAIGGISLVLKALWAMITRPFRRK